MQFCNKMAGLLLSRTGYPIALAVDDYRRAKHLPFVQQYGQSVATE